LTTAETVKVSYAERVKAEIADFPFIVEATRGKLHEFPLEPRGEYTYDELDANGRVRVKHEQPTLVFDRFASQCVIPRDAKGKRLIKLVEQKLAEHESGEYPDERVEKYGLRVLKPGQVPQPFPNWDKLQAQELKRMVSNMLEGDDSKDQKLLDQCVRYELQRGERTAAEGERVLKTRQGVIDMLEALFDAPGVEDDDAEVDL
jgi:hypothetical protein